ncbi:hypothetical protein AYJ01_08085 [Shewanella algae]|nr:hypothetical protein AYJ01_08085 [Shewanella algae]
MKATSRVAFFMTIVKLRSFFARISSAPDRQAFIRINGTPSLVGGSIQKSPDKMAGLSRKGESAFYQNF